MSLSTCAHTGNGVVFEPFYSVDVLAEQPTEQSTKQAEVGQVEQVEQVG